MVERSEPANSLSAWGRGGISHHTRSAAAAGLLRKDNSARAWGGPAEAR